jgi:hypothetical protein
MKAVKKLLPKPVVFESRDQAMRQAVESYGHARGYEISLWLGNARPELKGEAFMAEARRAAEQVKQAERLIFLIANSPAPPQSQKTDDRRLTTAGGAA